MADFPATGSSLTSPDNPLAVPAEGDTSAGSVSEPSSFGPAAEPGSHVTQLGKSPADDGPKTVLNPLRRRRDRNSVGGTPENEVLRLLFPTDSEIRRGDAPAEPLGIRLEHFEIIERIGSGGMSRVFKATDTRLETTVALKVLAPDQSRDDEAVQRFLNEARAAARLNHPNIVKSFYVGSDKGLHFIAYEYVDGSNLRDHVRRRGHLDVREAVNIAIQVALGLQHAESRGIVHRDVKPSNIVINAQGQAKLIDLGLARLPAAPGDELTIAGTTLGTFDYVSPEQAKDPRNVDGRSDVYSLGCTLYHMLTGEPPYADGTMLQKLLDHQGKQPPNPAARNPRVPPSLGHLCQRMMASQPRRRPASAEALLRELAGIARELGLQASQPDGLVWGAPQVRSPFWEKHLGWMSTVGLLLLIVFVIDKFPLDSPEPADRPAPRTESRSDADRRAVTPGPDATKRDDAVSAVDDGPTERLPERPLIDDDPGREGGAEIPAPPAADPDEPKPATPADIPKEGPPKPAEEPTDPRTVASGQPSDGPAISIVPKGGGPLRGFASLPAAVAAAADGDVVELAYDGVREFRPMRVVGKSITIRAASGFRPTVHMTHEEVPSEGASVRMVSVSKGAVDLVNLDILLTVDETVVTAEGERWSLFAVHGNERVEVRNARITVRNPGLREVALVDLLPESEQPLGTMEMIKPVGDAVRADIRFSNVFVRGETDVVAIDRTRPVRIDLEGSLLAVGQSVVHLRGGPRNPGEADLVDVRAAHNTAFVGNGFLRFESGEFPRYLPPVHVSARNNIIATRTDVALVTAQGSTDLQNFQNLLRWEGDTNFYDGFRLFWTTPPSQTLAVVRDVDFEGWKQRWNSTGMQGSVTWVTAPEPEKYEAFEVTDFVLDPEVESNPAIGGATDGSDAGADLKDVGPTTR